MYYVLIIEAWHFTCSVHNWMETILSRLLQALLPPVCGWRLFDAALADFQITRVLKHHRRYAYLVVTSANYFLALHSAIKFK